jgi:DNA ligase-1
MTEHSWPTLFVKTAAGNINYWQIWTEGSTVHTRWGKVGTDKPLTDSYEAVAKNVGRSNETAPHVQARLEAQSKFDKQLRLKYVRSQEEAEANINIKPMRAYTLDEKRQKKLKFPVHVQPKFNGVRCMAYNLPDGTVRLMSRGGKDYTLPHVQNELRGRLMDGMCLDGELYVHGMSLQTIRHHIETYSEHSVAVKLHCYDYLTLPPAADSWRDRFDMLLQWFRDNPRLLAVELSLTATANSMEEIEDLHGAWVEDGYEGAMVRIMDGPYRMAAKSTKLLKYKHFFDAEFKVVDWDVGKDGVIKYTCVQEEDLKFEVRPMGNEAERKRLLMEADNDMGKMLTVRFQERSNDNIPLHGRGVAFRPAKDLD